MVEILLTSIAGSVIERKKVAVTWHYRGADPEHGAHQAQECQKHLESTIAKKWEVEVMTGKANLEVRPRFVNKGEIAKRLVEMYGGPDSSLQFVFCAGDDFTDEGTRPLNQLLILIAGEETNSRLCFQQICSVHCDSPNCPQKARSR
jgi:trehalose-phosphatase